MPSAMALLSPTPIGVIWITLAIYLIIVLGSFIAARNDYILASKVRRGIAAASCIGSLLVAPIAPYLAWPDARVETLSLCAWWLVSCVTFVGALRIYDLVYLREPTEIKSMPALQFFAILLFNPEPSYFQQKPRRHHKRFVHPTWTVGAVLPTKAMILFLLLLGPVTDDFEKQMLRDLFTWNMFTLRYLIGGMMLGCCFYPTLSIPFDLILAFGELVTGVPMNPLFQNPLFSTSMRDFWSGRWNMLVKNTFHRAVFDPSVQNISEQIQVVKEVVSNHSLEPIQNMVKKVVLSSNDSKEELKQSTETKPVTNGHVNGDAEHKGVNGHAKEASHHGKGKKKGFTLSSTLASLQVFLVSGVSHDWLNFVAFHTFRGDNMLFFLIHGLLTTLQVAFKYLAPATINRALNDLPKPVKILSMWIIMGFTCPIFMRQYLESGFYTEVRVFAKASVKALAAMADRPGGIYSYF
ncbi:hypothetical protein M427DRAFT_58843 [Gonapodya prolifera JEL478]|uniref:Wax synthase domain-containing protein n=1 Tax=Gonapodya prolifera (strain JEL478) TaxID=1344416 RepID=A0A139AAC6_GONPJ|nr:hypothetical protein M427DRAFT_58843 [Gonapodya prolifera JEL478]|eukprot:KXS13323.1 hypothetical protein M427DRAFT_58843 [Gonapodya prolifera JEL478]